MLPLAFILMALPFLLLQSHKFPQRLDYMAQDALSKIMPVPEKPAGTPKIVTVLLGERSLRQVGQWPWPRDEHAALLLRLDAAALVVFDIVMPEHSSPAGDTALAEAVHRHGRVLTALYMSDGSDTSGPAYPYPELLEASAGLGVVNAVPDSDGVIRRAKILWEADGLGLPSLPLAAARAVSGAEPVIRPQNGGYMLEWQEPASAKQGFVPPPVPLDENLSARFSPSETRAIEAYEYIDVSDGSIAPELFKNAIVIIGSSGAGTADLHRVPNERSVPGLFLIAQAVSGLFSGQTLDEAPAWQWGLPALLLGFAAFAAGSRVQIKKGVLAIALVLLAWALAWSVLFLSRQVIIPLAVPCGVFLLLFIETAFFRLAVIERGREASNLPLDEILLAPGSSSRPLSNIEYGDYLENVWPKINRLFGLLLLKARAGSEDADVAACLAADKENTAQGLLLIQNFSKRSPQHRMLIPLPFSGLEEYTLTAWDGTLNEDSLKSAAALVVSIAMQYTIMEEQQRRQNMLVSTIQAISGAIDAKDPVTAGHSQRVAELARDLALWLDWPKELADDLFLSGILHDVGKIGVADSILNKPGKLSEEEFASMKTHPAKGHSIMLPIDTAEPIMRGILEHHERLDGKGYPGGLTSDEISDFAKILKIADVYDALVSKRQYKEAWTPEKACGLLYSQRGSEFDAGMVDVFLRHMAPSGWLPPQNDPA